MNDEEDILGLNQMIDEAGGLVNFTIEEREQVNQAGAEVLQKHIAEATKEKHYQENRHVSKKDVEHLADSIETGNLEGTKSDGDRSVGFSVKDANHARVARWLNDGTKAIKGDGFYDKAVEEATEDVEKAKQIKLQQIIDKKG